MKISNTLRNYFFLMIGISLSTLAIAQNGTIEADEGVKVGNNTSTVDGTIRYTGSDFEGRKAGTWTSLTGGGGSSPWNTVGGEINYLGNVGIGITNPAVDLHIDGSGEALRLTGGNPWWSLRQDANDSTYGFGWMQADSLKFGMNGPGQMHFQTMLQSRLIIDNTGEIGIGTNDPSGLLEIYGDSNTGTPGLLITETSDNDYSRINFKNTNAPSDRWTMGALFGTTSDNLLGWFYNGNVKMAYNETNDGLGIGTTNPDGKLHVANGDSYYTGSNPRIFLINTGDADTRIGFGNNGGGADDAAIFYDSSEDKLTLGTSTTTGNLHINGAGKIGANVSSGLTAQMSIRANAGNVTTPATLELMENNNSGYPVLKYSNFSTVGHFTNDANGQYGNFIGGDADFRIRYTEDGTTFNTIMTAMYAYDNESGSAVNAKDERIGIRTETPDADLHLVHKNGVSGHGFKIQHEGTNNHWWKFYVSDGAGTLALRNDGSASNVGTFATDGMYTASDSKLKNSVRKLPYGLKDVMKLQTKAYRYNSESDKTSIGFIAQEVNEIIPEIVMYDKEADQYSVNYSATGILAIKAIQEQQEIIENQQAQIDELIRINKKILAKLDK